MIVSNERPIRWGVLGAAKIAIQKVIPAMRASESGVVHAIASRSSDKAAEVATALGIPNAYGSYEELLADEEVEAVYVPLPNNLHAPWTVNAAESGKHVLCEKPLAMTASEARQMVDACERSGVRLMEGFMYRLHPLWVEVKRLVDSGAIGTLRAVDTVFTYSNPDPTNIRNRVETGGGAVYDIGCYAINVARMLFDENPSAILSSLYEEDPSGVDVLATGTLQFETGSASFTCSTRVEPHQRVDIYGSNGRLAVETPFNIPPDRPTSIGHVAGGAPSTDQHVSYSEIPAADQYSVMADAFSRAIREDVEVPIAIEDSIANMEVIDRIFEHAERRVLG